MHTMGEAAQLLGIGRVTLEKWCKLLMIEPKRHKYDLRYRLLSDDDLEHIRTEMATLPGRAKMPAKIPGTAIPPYSSLAFDRRSPVELTGTIVNDATSPDAPMPRQRPLHVAIQTSDVLPDGLLSRSDAAHRHNVPLTTLRRWCDELRIECDPGTYGGERGQYAVRQPLTRRGLAQLYALASMRADFTRCPECPHSTSSATDE